nr:MAG: hypothetical protein 3 [Leviviridae sp.]
MKRTTSMTDLAPFAAVFLDTVAWAPDLRPSLERDYQRLVQVVSTRGMSFITIDMPEAGKVVDQALSRGWIDFSSLPPTFGKVAKGGQGYFLGGLLQKVFTPDGYLREDPDVQYIFFIRQILYLVKKIDLPCSDAAQEAAITDFIQIDAQLRRPTLSWDLDELDVHGLKDLSFCDGHRSQPDLISHRDVVPLALLRLLDKVCEIVVRQFPTFTWQDLVPRHGPGSVSDVKTGEDKYTFPNWPRKLDLSFPYESYAQHREDLHLYVNKSRSLHEPAARLAAVPKTQKGPRLISVEPVAHQFLQQALLRWTRDSFPRLLRNSVDFKDQSKSQMAALAASVSGTVATVDLSSASDRLSCWVVERLFRGLLEPDLLIALHACRTRMIEVREKEGKNLFLLRKYAGQGNATTFPVQSIYYFCVAIAAILYEEGRSPSHNSVKRATKLVRVFGDDIIVPSFAVSSLTHLLSHTGLKVNMGKTHASGYFRESCGMDAYKGVDVTPLYIRSLSLGESSESLVSWIDVSNNAYRKGLWVLSDWMWGQVPERIRKLIPVSRDTMSCLSLLSYQEGLRHSCQTRYNVHLQREEILALQGSSQTVTKRREGHDNLLQYFLEFPEPDLLGVFPVWSSGYVVKKRSLVKKRWVPV